MDEGGRSSHRIPPTILWADGTEMRFTGKMQTLLEGQVWVVTVLCMLRETDRKNCKTHREHVMMQGTESLLEFGIQWSRF